MIMPSLAQAATRSGLTEPNIRRDPDNPSLLHVRVRPASLDEWRSWLDLVGAEPGSAHAAFGSGIVHARGTWRDCRIALHGHNIPTD